MSGAAENPPAQVRQAHPAEATTLHAIDALTSPAPMGIDRYRKACQGRAGDPEYALVVLTGAAVAGYVLLSQVLDEVTVLNIAVAPQHQGQGLGGLLLAGALREAFAAGAHRCLLEVRASNRSALALYRRQGFIEDGVRRNYYPSGAGREDALLMSKEL